jgi:ABC-type transporter Mla maintaining outer membrane lipid asymmetry ATPase subunit MlaF
MTAPPVIELIGADVARSDNPSAAPVARDVNWKIEAGHFWCIGSFAGTGKNDLLCAAAGLVRPLSGELALFGKPVKQMDEEELVVTRLKVAMVFDTGRLFSHLTVAENIGLPIEYHEGIRPHRAKDRILFALELTGLVQLADQFPRLVPRALHQRVALARALALSPDVLLVDNPLLGVDQRNAQWWIEFLCAAHAGKTALGKPLTLVVAADDLRPWLDAAQQFGIIRDRRFEIIASPEEVINASDELGRDFFTPASE